jgi:uncharacterized membrane protein YfhO
MRLMAEERTTLQKAPLRMSTKTDGIILQLLNLRLYSIVDLLFLAVLARGLADPDSAFGVKDVLVAIALLSQWFFFNTILEAVHAYRDRGQSSAVGSLSFLALAVVIGTTISLESLVPIFASSLGVGAYLLKKRARLFGPTSCLVRGLIQSQYFLFAMAAYGNQLFARASINGVRSEGCLKG